MVILATKTEKNKDQKQNIYISKNIYNFKNYHSCHHICIIVHVCLYAYICHNHKFKPSYVFVFMFRIPCTYSLIKRCKYFK